jgi:hypothetical protein
MEMKPEYNYGEVTRYLLAVPNNTWANRTRKVYHTLQEFDNQLQNLSYFKFWRRYWRESFIGAWRSYSEADFRAVTQKLQGAGAKLMFGQDSKPLLTPFDAFYPDNDAHLDALPEVEAYELRNLSTDRAVDLSCILRQCDEYSLYHWAQANGIREAYRFTKQRSPGRGITVRIWIDHTNQIMVFYGDMFLLIGRIPENLLLNVSLETWEPFQAFMIEHFWTATAWETIYPRHVVLDGTDCIFEGYRNGKYHVLYAISPDKNDSGGQAVQLFNSLAEMVIKTL